MKEILYVWAKGLKNSCGQCFSPSSPIHFYLSTVKPVLRGHCIKRTPSIKRTVAEVPKFISLIYFK